MSEPLGLEPLPLPPLPTPGALFQLVRAGQAASRADLARLTGLSASTVTARVEELVAAGLLEEGGQGESRGGRRPRRLQVRTGGRVLVGVDLGEHHASYAVLDRDGVVVADARDAVSLADGPEAVVRAVVARARDLVAGLPGRPRAGAGAAGGAGSAGAAGVPGSAGVPTAGPRELGGIAMGLPGPVDSRTGRLVSPSRMPGWNGVAVRALLEERSGLPARVENDANAMALGEFAHRGGEVRELVYVKAGTGIGCGVVLGGRLYRGFRGVAGDISHTAVAGAPPVPCSCGRAGCLDVVASGSAVLDALREDGVHVADMPGLLAIASDAHPRATRLLREAGARTGEVLAAIVNVLNPQALVLGGALSRSEAFVAGVRQAIYAQCLPMATDLLDLSVSEAGWLAGATGVGRSLLDDLLHPALVDAALRDGSGVAV